MNQIAPMSEGVLREAVPHPSPEFRVPFLEAGAFACKFILGEASQHAVCILAALALAVCGTSLAQAGTPRCAPHADMLSVLAKQYGEAPQAIGLVNGNTVLEVLSSKMGSFTILVTKADGMACIVAAGQEFEKVPDHLASLDPQA